MCIRDSVRFQTHLVRHPRRHRHRRHPRRADQRVDFVPAEHTVSYTHLDVYKRQGYHSVVCNYFAGSVLPALSAGTVSLR